ncbi:MAG: tRNA adenosine(34) deaminase TadA [Deltaproteobacteria bacterium]|nr:tRNA adenosine(34) deaminase TadA [Deltaproteobacteria bacterium]
MRDHAYYMNIALEQAAIAGEQGEVPVGAVVVMDDTVIAAAHNSVVSMDDPSAHAEVLALRRAGARLRNYRLTGTRLYVTIEPCIMCAGAMIHARIGHLIFGAYDDRSGAMTLFDAFNNGRLNHRVEVVPGINGRTASMLLRDFFKKRRASVDTAHHRSMMPSGT